MASAQVHAGPNDAARSAACTVALDHQIYQRQQGDLEFPHELCACFGGLKHRREVTSQFPQLIRARHGLHDELSDSLAEKESPEIVRRVHLRSSSLAASVQWTQNSEPAPLLAVCALRDLGRGRGGLTVLLSAGSEFRRSETQNVLPRMGRPLFVHPASSIRRTASRRRSLTSAARCSGQSTSTSGTWRRMSPMSSLGSAYGTSSCHRPAASKTPC